MLQEFNCDLIEIIRGSTHDGPGMRTTVFFKGCPLNCLWCQNPEGIPSAQGVWWDERKCIRCLECIQVCPNQAVVEDEHGLRRDPDKCTVCGACVDECPAKGVTYTGEQWSLERLLAEVLKDQAYFSAFDGGVTVSGGEPLRQYPFVTAFFQRLKEAGVNTALDTCGLAPWDAFAAVLPYADTVLFDIKLIDAQLHRQFTGQSNQLILKNLAACADFIRDANRSRNSPIKLWIRTPLIPETTATEENITAIGRFIHENLADVVQRWELCAFNPTCVSKYQKLGRPWAYADYPLMDQVLVERMKTAALSPGFAEEKLVVSGMVAHESG